MSTDVSPSLCTRCGLCCSGAIFADVELRDRREATEMESLGLEVEEEEGRHLLVQRCLGLNGTRCTVYAHRPECCRDFECKLLSEYRSGKLGLNDAMAIIQEVRQRVNRHGDESTRSLIDERFLNR